MAFPPALWQKLTQKVGSGFGFPFARPAQHCWNGSASAELGWREDGDWQSGLAGGHSPHAGCCCSIALCFTCWPLHPKCMLIGLCERFPPTGRIPVPV